MKKILLTLLIGISLSFAGVANAQFSILRGAQGGTGLGSATAGEIGYCLKVLAVSPLSYVLGSCGGGGGVAGAISTTTPLVDTQVVFSTGVSSIGNDANFTFNSTADRLTVTFASTTGISTSYASSTLGYFGSLFIPALSQGFSYIGSNGKVNSIASSSIQLSWFNNDSGFLTAIVADSPLSGSGTSGSHLTLDTSGTWTGNAGTASALAANGTNCSAGSYPLGVDASGNVENCTVASTGSGSGNVATSTNETAGRLAYWTSNSGTPALLGEVATTTFTPNSDFSVTGTIGNFVGGANSTLALNMATAHNWTGLQSFVNSSTTLGSFDYASSTDLRAGSLTFGGVTGSTWSSFCTAITGGSGLCDGVDDTSAGGNSLATSSPWTFGNLAVALTNGTVTTISTSTLVNNIFPFTSYGISTSSVFGFNGGLFSTASSTFGSDLFLPSLGQGILYTGSNGIVKSTATSSFSLSQFTNDLATLTNDATLNGSAYNGSSAISDWGLNLANPNTWTVNQTFNYSSSTIYSSFLTASSTNFVGGGLTTCTGSNFLQYSAAGFFGCAAGAGGGSDPFTHPATGQSATTSLMLLYGNASTTGLSSNYAYFGGTATTTINSIGSITMPLGSIFTLGTTTPGILRTNASGVVYASSATSTVSLFNGFTIPDTGGNSWVQPSTINAPASISGNMVYIASSTSAKTGFYGTIALPKNFASSTSQIVVGWTATSTGTGNVVFDFDYRCVSGDNTTSLYQTSWQESTTTTVANPTTGGFRKKTIIDINTGYWCSAEDTMQFYIARDGADGADTSTVDTEIYSASLKIPTQ